jgi:lipopolysaccharide transport system permease protein
MRFLKLINPVAVLKNVRELLPVTYMFAKRDFRSQHVGTLMGVAWLIITPLVMLSIYTFIFSHVFKARWETFPGDQNIYTFALLLFAGMIPYQYFSDVTGRSTGILLANVNYIKKVKFPLEILPLGLAFSHLLTFLMSSLILLLGVLCLGHAQMTMFLLPVIFLPLFLLASGVAWIIAICGVYLRDVAKAWMIFLNLLFFLTPIFYPLERLPHSLQTIVRLNPMTVMIENFRAIMVIGSLPNWKWFAVSSALGFGFFILGHALFMRAKHGLCDVI